MTYESWLNAQKRSALSARFTARLSQDYVATMEQPIGDIGWEVTDIYYSKEPRQGRLTYPEGNYCGPWPRADRQSMGITDLERYEQEQNMNTKDLEFDTLQIVEVMERKARDEGWEPYAVEVRASDPPSDRLKELIFQMERDALIHRGHTYEGGWFHHPRREGSMVIRSRFTARTVTAEEV